MTRFLAGTLEPCAIRQRALPVRFSPLVPPHGTLASFTGHTAPRKPLICLAPRAGYEPATNRLTAPYDGVFCCNLPVHDPGKTFVPSEKGAM